MTNGEIDECVAALSEYHDASIAYANSYDAIDRYKIADSNLRTLLWQHGIALIAIAKEHRDKDE